MDPSIWTDEEYYVKNDEKTLSWSTSDTGDPGCGAVEWSLTMSDGSSIDTSVFTLVNFASSNTKELKVHTVDDNKVDIYELKTTVAYVNRPNDSAKSAFWQIEVKGRR